MLTHLPKKGDRLEFRATAGTFEATVSSVAASSVSLADVKLAIPAKRPSAAISALLEIGHLIPQKQKVCNVKVIGRTRY